MPTTSLFTKLNQFILDSNASNSNNDKIEVIKAWQNHDEIMNLLWWVYNPFKNFGVTSKHCKKRPDLTNSHWYGNIFDLLYHLSEGNLTGHEAIAAVNNFANTLYPTERELFWRVIDRNLKTRATADTINKVIPGWIPEFNVALAKNYDDHKKKVNFVKQTWFGSCKLDGIRCITWVDNQGNATFYSRQGKEFHTLQLIQDYIKELGIKDCVLDGEVCIVDENGQEDFTSIQKEIRRKNHTIPNPKYFVFDILTHDEFLNKKSEQRFNERHNKLVELLGSNQDKTVSTLKQYFIRDKDDFKYLQERMASEGWEGLMLRRDTIYEGKRTDNLLKVKNFYEAEYKVVDYENGPFRVIVDGKEVEENMLSHVYIQHKGYKVSVGSGFSFEDRRYYRDHPQELIGAELTITYFDESQNKEGEKSLRFPTVKAIWPNGRNV